MSIINTISEILPLHIFHLDDFWSEAVDLGANIWRSEFGQFCRLELSEAGERLGAYLVEVLESEVKEHVEAVEKAAEAKIDEVAGE